MKKVYVFLADGFEETEAIFPIDLLIRAGATVEKVSVTGKKKVTGSHNITVIADSLFDDNNYNDADMLFLPGGPGHKTLLEHADLIELVKKANEEKKWLAAICAAPMIYGSLGLLDGKAATCFPGYEQYLKGAVTTGAPYEISGNFVTGRSAGTAREFALAMVEALFGKDASKEVAKAIVS